MYFIRHGHSLHNTVDEVTGVRTGDQFWKYSNDDILSLTNRGIEETHKFAGVVARALDEERKSLKEAFPYSMWSFQSFSSPSIRAQQTRSLILSTLIYEHGFTAEDLRIAGRHDHHILVPSLQEVPTPSIRQHFRDFRFDRFKEDPEYEFDGQSYSKWVLNFMSTEDKKLYWAATHSIENGEAAGSSLVVGHHYSLTIFLLHVLNNYWHELFITSRNEDCVQMDQRFPPINRNFLHAMHKLYMHQNTLHDLMEIRKFMDIQAGLKAPCPLPMMDSLREHFLEFGVKMRG